jgi:carboxymethylenebutenolidase
VLIVGVYEKNVNLANLLANVLIAIVSWKKKMDDGVYNFYKNDFVGKMPEDTNIVRISRTVSKDQVVDELILSFTHDIEIKPMLPGIAPTGKHIEIPIVIIMKFDGTNAAHEHLYWDQASVLAQIGVVDTKNLPIVGIEQTRKLLEISQKNIQTR